MAAESAEDRREGAPDGTYVVIHNTRFCESIFGRKLCSPWVREYAEVHLGRDTAEKLATGVGEAAGAISGALTATGVGVAAAPWVALAGALVVIGYHALKNADGSIDLDINNLRVAAGVARVPVHVDPASCGVILQGM